VVQKRPSDAVVEKPFLPCGKKGDLLSGVHR